MNDEDRVTHILNNLLQLASGNFKISDLKDVNNDSIGAVERGVFMLGEELEANKIEQDRLNLDNQTLVKELQNKDLKLKNAWYEKEVFQKKLLENEKKRVKDLHIIQEEINIKNKLLSTRNLELEKSTISINEKNTLLKEIHHRVKNNLQVITSLLSLQANTITNTDLRAIFNQSQYRINSMALVHEMLYQSDNLSVVNYNTYLKELITTLISSIKGFKNNIKLDLATNNISINVDTAIPLGLLINEIITNSLKYAFNKDEFGALSLNLKQLNDNRLLLKIGDDGKGFSNIGSVNLKSIGLKLINKLVRQLKGSIEKDETKKGTNYIIEFQKINYER
jgi:two-component sensor histidine kinase